MGTRGTVILSNHVNDGPLMPMAIFMPMPSNSDIVRTPPSTTTALRIVYLVTEDWYFVSHRLPMARAAKRAGFEVHVATRVLAHASAIEREGFVLHRLGWRRGSLNPLHLLSVMFEVRGLYRRIKPALAHHVALLPTIVGSVAALGLPLVCLNALAGLGFAFTSTTPKARLVRFAIRRLLKWLLNRKLATVLVQNPDDFVVLEALGVSGDKMVRIGGSGVDTDKLTPLAEPPLPITAGFLGRLLADKGLPALIEAHALLAARGRRIDLLIAGGPDPANPASIPAATIAEWQQRPGLTFLGHVDDVRAFWAKAHIAVLPSLREGLPLSLLEAAACGRPIVATNVPGCREIARPGVNAILVPPEDPAALANAFERLADDAELRQCYGAAGRVMVESEFSHHRVGQQTVALYQSLLEPVPEICKGR